ncbi:hypothetical protein [Flavobacterium branchiicola]|uniref:DUF4421 domain-containing protein n=1 Tax=Flavobacterium branchiicola TaxID=1114875 RepID=A0ABV9PAR9_9FLAO|nr:hypothetical protein [Flavobacterium branchiicola]MBS7252795.1 hypothetical protein [Flavobacterium branchiicola]
MSAQNDTIFFDKNWKIITKENATYYRIKPQKIKTKKAVGYKIENVDSLFVIKDYYLKNNQLQFQGYSSDFDSKYLFGKAEWFNAEGQMVDASNFNYRKKNAGFKIPESKLPIFYIDYKIANKSLLTGGLEFCLDCQNKNKLFIGAGFGITNSYNGNYYGLPDLHLSYNRELLFFKTGSSHKNAYVLGGFTFLNAIDLGLGYSFPYTNENIPVYKSFTTSLTFRISKNKKAFGQLKMM